MNDATSKKRIIALNLPVAIFLVLLIAILACLDPSASGLGTHEQIIPVPCLFKLALGVPCPSCGLTTSLAHFFHGNLRASLKAHLLGPFVALIIIFFIFKSIRGIFQNKSFWTLFEKRWFHTSVIYGICVYLGIWIVKLII